MKNSILKNGSLVALTALLWAASAAAQATTASKACPDEIPTGVRIVSLPDAEQHKVSVSEFKVSANKDASSYDLAMRIKNGTDNWCITSFAIVYSFGDARGQEWVAHEYPAVKRFTMTSDAAAPPVSKGKPAPSSPVHSVGLSPGRDEARLLSNVYDYIQPRPAGYFDGFHVISGELQSCMGYPLDLPKQ